MSQFDKLLKRIKSLDKDLRFDEVAKVLKAYGYVMDKPGGGSHRTFRKPGCDVITIPDHGLIKTAYIRIVKAIVEGEENNEKNS
jgi:predicted RNA binding protein YcfA (HicA-like mRNA interferase family)